MAGFNKQRRLLLKAGVGAAALLGLGWNIFSPDNRNLYERGYELDIRTLRQHILEKPQPYIIGNAEIKNHLEVLVDDCRQKGARCTDIVYDKAEKHSTVRFEPDRDYASALISQAKDSIAHMVSFLGTPYVKNEQADYFIPSSSKSISFTPDSLAYYLVADLESVVTVYFTLHINGAKGWVEVPWTYNLSGETSRQVQVTAVEQGFRIDDIDYEPVFYSTSLGIVKRVETPAIEFLHNSVAAYTHSHLEQELKTTAHNQDALSTALNRQMHREEKFVHALSILWLPEYNKDRNLSLTSAEMKKRFDDYEQKDSGNIQYNGANAMSKHIKKIGIPKAFELYINNPDKLFSVIGY